MASATISTPITSVRFGIPNCANSFAVSMREANEGGVYVFMAVVVAFVYVAPVSVVFTLVVTLLLGSSSIMVIVISNVASSASSMASSCSCRRRRRWRPIRSPRRQRARLQRSLSARLLCIVASTAPSSFCAVAGGTDRLIEIMVALLGMLFSVEHHCSEKVCAIVPRLLPWNTYFELGDEAIAFSVCMLAVPKPTVKIGIPDALIAIAVAIAAESPPYLADCIPSVNKMMTSGKVEVPVLRTALPSSRPAPMLVEPEVV